MGSGVFLVFGIVARKGAAAGLSGRSCAAGDGDHRDRRRLRGERARRRSGAAAVRGDGPGDAEPRRLDEASGGRSRAPNDGWRRRHRGDGGRKPARRWRSSCRRSACCCRLLIGGRQAERIALALMPVEFAVAVAIAVLRLALRPAARLHARRLCAAARHRAAGRRIFRRHARDGGADRAGRRALRPGQFRDAGGNRKARAARVLDLVAGPAGGAEPDLSGRRSLQSLCRARASDLRRGSAGFVSTDVRRRWPRRCAISCSLCSARCSICSASPCSTGLMARSTSRSLPPAFAPEPAVWLAAGLMTAGLLGEDRAFSAAFVAAARPRQRARRRRAPCCRGWWSRGRFFSLSGSGLTCWRLSRA